MEEVWKAIDGYEGLYQVSNLGRVRSLDRIKNNHFYKGKVLKELKDRDGYSIVNLYGCKISKTHKVHRLVALAFVANPKNLHQVNHIDENKGNNAASNLEWCTPWYNLTYGSRRGSMVGIRNIKAKLTESDVQEIRRTYKKGDLTFGQSALGKKYGISHTQIGNIVRGESWKSLPGLAKEIE